MFLPTGAKTEENGDADRAVPVTEDKEQRAMRSIKKTAALSATVLALAAGTASAATIDGTPEGDALYGTPQADTIYGYGGADLVYGYGDKDVLHGGDERGWGDKILGGGAADRVFGERGGDAVYGERGDDMVSGGYGNDTVVGGSGNDLLDGGPGSDEMNARDGQKDTILIRSGEYDTVYYDRGLDVLQNQESPQGTASKGTGLTAGKVQLLTQRPPEGLFEPFGKVLVEHEGEELLLPENALKGHLDHGDEIVDPTGRSQTQGERRSE
jgi:Ca2+-binding RTX toxin-like protein